MTELSSTPSKSRPDYAFAFWMTLLFALTLFPRIYLHIPWRDELHTWTIASADTSLSTLFARIRYEGHPSVWYLLIRTASEIWDHPMSMQILHGLLACIPVYLIAAFAPAPRWQRVLLGTGYFFAFEHAIIARNYVPAVAALVAFAVVVTRFPRAYIPAALLLVVAINTNVMAALLAIAISMWIGLRWLKEGRPVPVRFVTGVAIVCAGFLLAFLQMRSPPDRHWAETTLNIDPVRAGKMAAAMWRSFVPIPSPGRNWWGTNVLDFQPITNKLNAIQGLLGIATFFAAARLLPKRRDVRVLWFAGAVILVGFGYFKYVGSLRHHSHFFILFVVAWWLGRAGAQEETITSDRKRAGYVFTGILVAQTAAALIAGIADTLLPFTANRATAQYIAANYPDAALIGHVDYTAVPVGQLLDKPVYFPRQAQWGTYVTWNTARIGIVPPEMLNAAGAKFRREDPNRPVLLILTDDAKAIDGKSAYQPDLTTFRHIARFDDATEETERYTLYEFVGR